MLYNLYFLCNLYHHIYVVKHRTASGAVTAGRGFGERKGEPACQRWWPPVGAPPTKPVSQSGAHTRTTAAAASAPPTTRPSELIRCSGPGSPGAGGRCQER